MTPPPLRLVNPYGHVYNDRKCLSAGSCPACDWLDGARAVVARLETMRRDQCAAMCIGAAIQKLERELKGETMTIEKGATLGAEGMR